MGIAVRHPLWLLLLLLLPLAAWLYWQHSGRARRRSLPILSTRLLLFACLILALAGTHRIQRSEDLTVVLLLDRSASISPADQEGAVEWVRQALAAMPPDDLAAIVAFGEDALVERSPSPDRTLTAIHSIPLLDGSDLAQAIHLGMGLLSGGRAGRLVLLSDGRETSGDAGAAARLAAARGITLDVVPIGSSPGDGEVWLDELRAPNQVHQGQAVELTLIVRSTTPTEALIDLLGEEGLLERRAVPLSPGENSFAFSVAAPEAGFQRYQAVITPLRDSWPQNNRAAAFTTVLGPPRLLLVEGAPGEAAALAQALRSAGLPAEVVSPGQLPATAQALASYDALFLVDVPARALPSGTMPLLRSYVRDLGHGLAMIGGPASFGRGGYLNTPVEELLPVELRPRDRTQRPELALVLVIDRSGSMSEGGTPGAGPSKLALVVEAAARVAETLEEGDFLGVVAFDTAAHWVVPLAPVDADSAARALAGLAPGGGTSIYAGLAAARDAILPAEPPLRHVILLSDGLSEGAGYEQIVDQMAAEGVTSSILAVGEAPPPLLAQLAERGGGRYFWVRQPAEIPQILLEETLTAMGAYLVEEPFLPILGDPSPMLDGLATESLPVLGGYNGTWPRETAQVPLLTHRGDPLLAHWNYGLGRAVAWTSDLKGVWASEWLEWAELPRFAAQMTGWMLPLPETGALQVETRVEGRQVQLSVTAQDEEGTPLDFLSGEAHLLDPALETLTATLVQVAAGRYEASLDLPQSGVYLAQVRLSDPAGTSYGSQSGIVVPYSPEYREPQPNPAALAELAFLGEGQALSDPRQAFAHTLPPARLVRDWGPAFLLAAALILPLDIALRRLRLSWSESRAFLQQVLETLPRRGRAPAEPAVPPPLLQTIRRVRRETGRQRFRPEEAAAPPAARSSPGEPPQPAAQEPPAPAEVLSRLRQAKERARGDRGTDTDRGIP